MTKKSRQKSDLDDSDPTSVLDLARNLESRLKSPKELLLMFRFLLGRIWYEPTRGYSQDEVFLLFDTYVKLSQVKDKLFISKHIKKIQILNMFFHLFRLTQLFLCGNKQSVTDLRYARVECLKLLLDHGLTINFLIDGNTYFGLAGKLNLEKFLKRRGTHPWTGLRNKRFVGVGYRDRGQYRDPGHDGSPDWKEVYGRLTPKDTPPRAIPGMRQRFLAIEDKLKVLHERHSRRLSWEIESVWPDLQERYVLDSSTNLLKIKSLGRI